MERFTLDMEASLARIQEETPRHPQLLLIRAIVAQGQRIVESFQAFPVEEFLEHERERQAAVYADVFAGPLGMSKDDYIDHFPYLPEQPEAYKGVYDYPLFVPVHPTLGLGRMLQLADFRFRANDSHRDYIDENGMPKIATGVKAWEDPQGVFDPKESYATWIAGDPSASSTIEEYRRGLPDNERGGNIYDAIALHLNGPKTLRRAELAFPGSTLELDQYRMEHVPYQSYVPGFAGMTIGGSWVGGRMYALPCLRAGREISIASQAA